MKKKVDIKTREQLYREFLRAFKQTKNTSGEQQKVYYAEMLEVIRKLIISCDMNVSEVGKCAESQPISWYKRTVSGEQAVLNSQRELLERFAELMSVESPEVYGDLIEEVFVAFRGLVKASNLTLKSVEMTRREIQGVSSKTGLAR